MNHTHSEAVDTPQLRLPDVTFSHHRGNENSIEANESVPVDIKGEAARVVFEFIFKLGRCGATCDEVEQVVLFNGKLLSHQTASARMTNLKAERRIVQRFDETPTQGKYKAKRKTRGGRNASVFIARKFATQYELALADKQVLERDTE